MKTPLCRASIHLLLVVLTLAVAPGCGNPSGAPSIPPLETFLIPFEAFTGNQTDSQAFVTELQGQVATLSFPADGEPSLSLSQTSGQPSWNHAALNVGFWSMAVVVGLAVPVAAFRASFQNIPLRQEDGSWVWSYSVRVGGSVHSAKLHGQFIAEGVRWDMGISKEGEYQDFLWYYGESNLPATEGFWVMKQSPAVPNDLLRIDWSRDISTGAPTIRYTNIVPGGPENGGYIDTQYVPTGTYSYIWDIYNKGQDNHTHIEWSGATGEGRVKDLRHFGDDSWHCWDSDRLDVTCP